ncbi:patatin-like phospholipase family protein [Cesiribacter sp. SM1]|uniref:patatin-like phospholipase family protein n=1 Tax=Cesiribacter sp. SM1 TaxID=2861196 RepID=UPI001CD6339C|nr:patatin-like phospholipase family protein [Cesiribacter sp. SM1]
MEQSNSPLPFRVPAGYSGIKRSLVLAGGGMRLAYQAGVLKALEEEGLQFTHADATSGGIFNLAMLLSGLSTAEMCNNWSTVRIKDFISYLPLRKYLSPLQLPAFGDADGIARKVFPHLGISVNRIRQEERLAGTFNVCNYSWKTNEAIPHPHVQLQHLIAGVSLPMLMPALKIGADWYIDAVWIKDANLLEAVKRGAEEIWLVWAIGNQHQYQGGSFRQYVHMIEMSANGALFAEFDYINELNSRIEKGDSPYGQKQEVKVHIIKPEYPLPLDNDLYFNRINTTTLIEMGYADAKEYCINASQYPAPPSPQSTKMQEPGVAFSCRARLMGQLQDREALLHLSFSIHDVEHFVEAHHPYRLVASLSFTTADLTYYGYQGRLVVGPGAAEGTKSGRFSFRIGISGEDYFMQGSWPLHTTSTASRAVEIALHKGSSAAGELVASSCFTTTATDWRYLQKSFSFYNTRSWIEKRKAKQKLKSYFFV